MLETVACAKQPEVRAGLRRLPEMPNQWLPEQISNDQKNKATFFQTFSLSYKQQQKQSHYFTEKTILTHRILIYIMSRRNRKFKAKKPPSALVAADSDCKQKNSATTATTATDLVPSRPFKPSIPDIKYLASALDLKVPDSYLDFCTNKKPPSSTRERLQRKHGCKMVTDYASVTMTLRENSGQLQKLGSGILHDHCRVVMSNAVRVAVDALVEREKEIMSRGSNSTIESTAAEARESINRSKPPKNTSPKAFTDNNRENPTDNKTNAPASVKATLQKDVPGSDLLETMTECACSSLDSSEDLCEGVNESKADCKICHRVGCTANCGHSILKKGIGHSHCTNVGVADASHPSLKQDKDKLCSDTESESEDSQSTGDTNTATHSSSSNSSEASGEEEKGAGSPADETVFAQFASFTDLAGMLFTPYGRTVVVATTKDLKRLRSIMTKKVLASPEIRRVMATSALYQDLEATHMRYGGESSWCMELEGCRCVNCKDKMDVVLKALVSNFIRIFVSVASDTESKNVARTD